MQYMLQNTDRYNVLEIGALGLPLCFQVLMSLPVQLSTGRAADVRSAGSLGRPDSGTDVQPDSIRGLSHGPAGRPMPPALNCRSGLRTI